MIISLTVVAKPTAAPQDQFDISRLHLEAADIYSGPRLDVPVAIRDDAARWQPVVDAFAADAAFRQAGGHVQPVPSNSTFNGPDTVLFTNGSRRAAAMSFDDSLATLLFNVTTIHALPAYFVQLANAALGNATTLRSPRWIKNHEY